VDAPGGYDEVGNAITAIDGTYSIGGLPATPIKVDFRDCHVVGPYLEQWWNNQPAYSSGDTLSLTPGMNVTGIDAQLAAAPAIRGTVTDSGGHPLTGVCAQATTTSFVGGLAHTDSAGRYSILLSTPGDYRVQFVDCNATPAFAGQWWNHQTSSGSAQTVTVASGQVVDGVDAVLTPGAVGTIAGTVTNLHGIPMTGVCVVGYLPNQYAVFAPVNADGTYTLTGVPSGTYALAFLGCDGGNPSSTVPDPEAPTTHYTAAWWKGVPLQLDQNNNGGPDPIAQGAELVTVAPGQHVDGHDWCFGCTAISLSTITPGDGSLTVPFTTPGLAAPDLLTASSVMRTTLTYTAACTSSTGGVAGSAEAGTSPITVPGLTPGATYTCVVSAADGPTIVATSTASRDIALAAAPNAPGASTRTAVSRLDVTGPGALARTGTSSTTTFGAFGLALLALGLALVITTRRRTSSM
jgi:LPXTG-motif cell wall-anchored protein